MSIKSNDKVSRSLSAILSGSDEEVVANTNESVACGDEAEKEQVEKEVEDAPAETAGAEEEPEEIEEISEEEVESARKAAEESSDDEEPEEISDDDNGEEPELDEKQNDDGEVVEEDEDDEPIAEEDVEEITDEEVESAREEMEAEEDEEPEEISDDDDSVEEVMDEDTVEPDEDSVEEDEDSVEPDEDATAEAVSALAKLGFGCSIDNDGKISVTACGEQPAEKEEKAEGCDCGSEGCPECDKKEEEASVTIRPVDAEEKVQADEVCSVLTGADTESPFYTVLIKGMPVAAIHLEDQPNAEAIRAYFLSNDYPTKLASAMSVSGVKNVLDTQHAKMFSAVASKSELAETMKAEAKAEFDKQLSEAIIATASKFANALKVAVAGMNKNFFTEPNDLKGAIYAAFAAEGKDENVAQAKTESIIAEAGSFFDTAIAKAQELMSKSDEAFAEVSEMIAKAGVAARATKTFANALEQGNNQIIAGMMAPKAEEQAEQATASAVSLLKTKKLFARR